MDVNREGNPLLQFRQVGMVYRGRGSHPVHAVESLTVSIDRGEFVSFVGPSGCGKSTILRLAAGLESATSGHVVYDGSPVNGPDRRRGFVFQSYNVFPWLTVQENIAFGLTHSDSDGSTGKVAKWLDFTGLMAFADAYPKALSGGMRQRLALARTMIVEPELLLLDEPFGALDERTRQSMQTLLLRAVSATGCAVIFVTHDIREAIFLADKLILLSARPGSIVDVFRVAASKPRSRDFFKSTEFGELYGELIERFPT